MLVVLKNKLCYREGVLKVLEGCMKYMRILCVTAFFLCSFAFADVFEKNERLVEVLKQNNIRIVVLCNFQGTNNVMDIVTSSRSPLYELTSYGLALLTDTIPVLEVENISHIYSNPAFRAEQTASLLGKAFRLLPEQVSIDSRLSMQSFGAAEGEDYDAYKARFTSQVDMLEGMPENGESGTAVFNRLQDFLISLEILQNQTVLIITHAFNYCHMSKCLTGKYGNIPSPGTFKVYDFNQE